MWSRTIKTFYVAEAALELLTFLPIPLRELVCTTQWMPQSLQGSIP